MNIGIVCFPSLGGSGVIATELAVALADRGHFVHVIANAPPQRALPTRERLLFHEVAAADYPIFDHPPYALALAAAIIQIHEQHQLDVVNVHYAIPHAASAYLATQALGTNAPRIVATLHGTDVTRLGADPRYRAITRFTVAAADGITVPSDYLRREAYRCLGLPAELGIEVIPNFVDTEVFTPPATRDRSRFDTLFSMSHPHAGDSRNVAAALVAAPDAPPAQDPRRQPRPGGTNSPPVLFHVSNFRPVKRTTDLIDVLACVRAQVPARLVLVGDGPDRPQTEQRARDQGLSEHVRFLGNRPDFVALAKHADAFVLSSESESFGVAALEALSCGVPVFGYRVGGLPEVVADGVGILVDPFDSSALARAIVTVVTDADRRKAMGIAARAHVCAHFRHEPAVARYESFFRAISTRPRREPSR